VNRDTPYTANQCADFLSKDRNRILGLIQKEVANPACGNFKPVRYEFEVGSTVGEFKKDYIEATEYLKILCAHLRFRPKEATVLCLYDFSALKTKIRYELK